MQSDNLLYYGDNLDILRRYVEDESVDLVYLDPPFNSNADYNVLFAEKSGEKVHAQIKTFEDTGAMSKIAVNETQDGNTLRKAIDYFCHLAVAPDFYRTIQNDKTFA